MKNNPKLLRKTSSLNLSKNTQIILSFDNLEKTISQKLFLQKFKAFNKIKF